MTNGSVYLSEASEGIFTPTAVVQFVLLAIIFLVAMVGNGLVCFVVYHFKQMRTIPNILIVNLSVIDLINSLINMPLFAGFYIFKADVFSGKWTSYVFSSLHNYMLYLNVLSLVLLMADRYGAIKFKFRYHAWKTKTKVYLGITFVWLTGTALIILLGFRRHIILSRYEGLPLIEYRRILYKTEGWKVALGLFGAPLIIITVLGALIWRSVKASRKRVKAMSTGDDCTPQGKEMLKLIREKEVQTLRSVVIIVVAYFICFVPAMTFGVGVRRGIDVPWLEYFAFFFTYFTSACNPIVYALRTCRFRQVIKDMFKEKLRRDLVVPLVSSQVCTNESRQPQNNEFHRNVQLLSVRHF